MNSQWGTIRSICSNSNDESILEEVRIYITNGISESKWKGSKTDTLLEAIEYSKEPLKFTKILSTLITKVKQENKND